MYTVNWRDLAAVISDSPPGVQDPTRENVLAHQRVNETVMMEHTVLPMSFGTVFKTRDDIIEFLRSAHEAFADVLNKMENKLEFGLKVLWDRDAVLLELEQDDEDIRRLKSEIASQKGSTYFARMQYGRLVDAALQARSERYVAEIFDGLRDVAVAARSNKPIGDRMIMNAAFLVSRAGRARVRRAREGARRALRQADVQVHGAVAAVQLRQHPAEAGARLTARADAATHPHMLLIDDLLLGGLRFVLDKLATVVDQEMNDESHLHQTLMEAQMRFEMGEISAEEFAGIERTVIDRLREIRAAREADAPALTDEGVRISSVEISGPDADVDVEMPAGCRTIDSARRAAATREVRQRARRADTRDALPARPRRARR